MNANTIVKVVDLLIFSSPIIWRHSTYAVYILHYSLYTSLNIVNISRHLKTRERSPWLSTRYETSIPTVGS